ncbi:MAG: NAD(P)H-binding protein [Gemmatimonadaceae bacterium]
MKATNGRPTYLVTGATGAVGRYVIDELLEHTDANLLIIARDPGRLPDGVRSHPRVLIRAGDLKSGAGLAALTEDVDAAVLLAAAWGTESGAQEVNADGTIALVQALRDRGVGRLVWFGTASLLNEVGEPLAEAERFGSPYIVSKAICRRRLLELMPEGLTILHPTVVVGGAPDRPLTHAARLTSEVDRRVWLAQWIAPEGRLHLVHAADLARMVRDALSQDARLTSREIIAGAPPVTARELLDVFLERSALRRRAALKLSVRRVELLTRVLHIQLSPWDHYCLTRANFAYRDATLTLNPVTDGRYPTARAILSTIPLQRSR